MYYSNTISEFGLGGKVKDTRRQLNALSDEQLSDIGVSRGQIDDVARGLSARVSAPIKRVLKGRDMSIAPLFRAFVSS
jgi:hypothetical protein